MNKRLGVLIIIITLFFLNVETGTSTPNNNNSSEEKEWTYIVFGGGDDLLHPSLSPDPYIELIMKIPVFFNGKINVICLYDANSDENGTAFYGHLKRVGLFRAKLEIIEEYEELNFLDYTTLRDFIIRCKNEYPAKRYFLQIHTHGWAWAGAIHDQVTNITYDKPLKVVSMNEIHKALEESGGIEILDFAATCYTGSFESAYELRNCTKFYIGSEEKSELSATFYTTLNNLRILQKYPHRSSETIAKKLVNRMRISHPYRFTPFDILLGQFLYNHPAVDSTYSAIKTSKLDDACVAIDKLAESLIENFEEFKDIITASRLQSEDFPGYYMPFGKMVDIYDFADLLIKNNYEKIYPNPYNLNMLHNLSLDVKKSLDEAIIANWAQVGHKNAHGLSLFFPYSHNYSIYLPYWDMQNYTTHKLEFTDNTLWDEFLVNYLDS